MIHAYSENYLKRAMEMMGEMFDYAINDCQIPGEEFSDLFVISILSQRIETGEPAILLGKSGVENALEIIGDRAVPAKVSYDRTPAFWIGWSICYYQWFTGHPFHKIFAAVTYSDMLDLYPALHESDLSKAVDVLEERYFAAISDTNLKQIRSAYGCSQHELAELSHVSLRSIQMYEQRQKDINKAQAITLYRLSRALGCKTEDLLEL